MSTPSNKELAQLLISGKRKSIDAKNAKHATAIRVAGHRLGKVLTVQKDGKAYSLVLSDSKIAHRTADIKKAERKKAARAVGASKAGAVPRAKAKAKTSLLD